MARPRPLARRWPLAFALAMALVALAFSALGAVMNADLGVACDVARPQACVRARAAAVAFAWASLAFLVIVIGAAVTLFCTGRRRPDRDPDAA